MATFIKSTNETVEADFSTTVNLAAPNVGSGKPADNLVVTAAATLITTGQNSAVVSATTGNRIIVNGDLLGLGKVIFATGGGQSISVGTSGSLTSLEGAAIQIQGTSNTISNSGEIDGGFNGILALAGSTYVTNLGAIRVSGVNTDGNSGAVALGGFNNGLTNHGTITAALGRAVTTNDGASSITNTGLMSSRTDVAVYMGGSADTVNTLVNSGTISREGGVEFAVGFGNADDSFVNTGLVLGSAILGGGDDKFDSRGGVITGEVYGAEGADILRGSIGEDRLFGGDGADQLFGGDGDDVLDGGSGEAFDGADVLDGGAGADVLIGASGNDTASYASAKTGVKANLSDSSANTGDAAGDTYTTIESLLGSAFADTLVGSAGYNWLRGAGGNDILQAGAGNDLLTGGAGADRMEGGTGDDKYDVDNAGDVIVELAAQGADQVTASVSYVLTAGASVETLQATAAGVINLTGNALAQTIKGNSSANVLNGKAGVDTLTGGLGKDAFVFDNLGGIDKIVDFSVADDTIHLDNAVFAALGADGAMSSVLFRIGTAAQDEDDRIIYNDVTGALFYDADGNGTGAAVQIATLSKTLALTNADFLVI